MRSCEDSVDAHTLADAISSDPLMSLKLFAHVGALRRGREGGEPETVIGALVMLGIPPFFRAFGRQATVSERLGVGTVERMGFDAVLRRSHRAANFAWGFALQRLDHDAAVIRSAAMLHDFAELLLWLDSPALLLGIQQRQDLDARLRSADAQVQTLGFTLAELQHELMLRWHLPKLLVEITDDRLHRDSAQVRNVTLAIRLARHTSKGWDNAAIPDDLREIAHLLHLGVEPTLQLLRNIDV
jgi:HD-like signal output (HDOD) protein